MLSFLRAPPPPKTDRTSRNFIVHEEGASSSEFRSAGSDYLLRNRHPPFAKTKTQSIMVPPSHYHMHQAEHSRIVEGSCHLYRDTAGKHWATLSADDLEAQKTAIIPQKLYHTINSASATEPLVLDVNLTPEHAEGEERFFRNFFGYLDDCRKAGQKPSFFQLMVFLRSSDTPQGLPMPSKWLGLVASKMFMNIMGWWGYWMLGYQESYPEYYLERQLA